MNVETGKLLKPGEARCPAISTQEILAQDKVAPPAWATEQSYEFMGDEDIDTERYLSPAYQDEEFKRLWTRTWQFACREEHIPEVGDYYVYDIGTYSFIVTRVAENDIRAYFNACLHRGTKLRASGTEGSASEFKCSFHGWSWNLDGTHKDHLCPWDFPHVNDDKFSLPEARVELLGGFVWINMDPDAPGLREYLGPAVSQAHRSLEARGPLYRLPCQQADSVRTGSSTWKPSWRPIMCSTPTRRSARPMPTPIRNTIPTAST